VIAVTLVALAATPAIAQNFTFDARRIAMGNGGNGDNPAESLPPKDPSYTSIVLPFGLFQVLKNRNVFDPSSTDFNPVFVLEYAASPVHYIVASLVNHDPNRDLNTYRGFALPQSLSEAGLIAPHFGGTIPFKRKRDGSYQGIFIGVGPYVSVDTDLESDPRLVALLASTTNVYLPNTDLTITNQSSEQLAMAVTGGYRARFTRPGASAASRDAIYIAANYNYLHGFRRDEFNLDVNLETNSTGLITVLPATTPILATRATATSGTGYSLDFGIEVVNNGWDAGIGVSGVNNHINWTNFTNDQYTLSSLTSSGSFVHTMLPSTTTTERVTVPVRTTGNVGYTAKGWSFTTELSRGLLGNSFNGGAEIRRRGIDLRAGGRYIQGRWHGTTGIGLNASRRFAVDIAAYGEDANLELHEKLALAVSLRFNHITKR
jgi:hypothetical protein